MCNIFFHPQICTKYYFYYNSFSEKGQHFLFPCSLMVPKYDSNKSTHSVSIPTLITWGF